MRSPIHPHLAVLASILLVSPVAALQGPASGVREVTVNLRDAEIAQVAEQVSRLTGRTLVLDPAVQGRVSVISSGPVGPAGVWELFLSVLRVRGYAAVQSGRIWRIVPQVAAVQGGARIVAGAGVRSQEVVTRLIRLQTLPSTEAVRILRPLIAAFGSIEASSRPNAILVTDYAENVVRIERIANSLDGGGGGIASFQSITLSNASAADAGQAIQRILGDEAAGGPRIAVDERSNVVLVRGTPAAIREARRVAAMMDTAGSVSLTTRVFRLRFSDAEIISGILRGVLGGQGEASNPVARTLADQPMASIGAGSLNRFDAGSAANLGGLAALAGASQPQPSSSGASGEISFSGKDIAIQASPALNAIVVRGSPATIATVEALITELDLRRPQVTIEAAIVEITGDASEQLGVQLAVGQAAQLGSFGGSSFSNAGTSLGNILSVIGAPAGLGFGADGAAISIGSRGNFSLLIQALSQSTKANLLSTPSLTTLDNEPAEIVVGQNVPFRTGSFTTQGNTTNPFTTIEREDVGITLRVVPRIHEGDVVRLEVSQEVSSLVNGTLAGAADLITNRRSIKTTVLADDGETIVLGGLITDDRLSSRSKVPLLGDIPVVGELFRSRRESQNKRTLFLFLRPTILRDRNDVAANAASRYSRLRSDEALQSNSRNLLANPPGNKLPLELKGVY